MRAAPLSSLSLVALVALVPLGMTLAACHRDEAVRVDLPSPAAPTASAAVAVDQLAPGELAEGQEQAFGLPIPRDLRVERRFDDSVAASAKLPAEWVANYVRRRVEADRVEIGPAQTVFDGARVKGGADKVLRIEVVQTPLGAQLVVRNVTPKPAEPGLSEAERWRKAGFSPDGRQLDLNHAQ